MASTFTSEDNSREVALQIKRGVQANLKAAAIIWHSGVIRELTGNRSGKEYFVPGTGGVSPAPVTVNVKHPRYKISSYTRMQGKRTGTVYRASAPGEAPASVLGDLRTSYRFQVGEGYAEIGSPLDKAFWLEKGTEKMAPRPHLLKAYQTNEKQIKSALDRNVI